MSIFVNNSQRFLALIFLLIFLSYIFVQVNNKPRLLILHSYHSSSWWVKRVNQGIEGVIDSEFYSVRYYYMDSKRQLNNSFKQRIGNQARGWINKWKPQVVIAVDDNAQKYVAQYFVNDPDMSIVYAGLNGELSDYGYQKATNVTGILERRPLNVVFNSIHDIYFEHENPESNSIKNILFLSDHSTTGDLNIQRMAKYALQQKTFTVTTRQACSFIDWQTIIQEAQINVDLIIVNGYNALLSKHSDSNYELCENGGSTVAAHEIVNWTLDNSLKVPIVGFSSTFVDDGGMLGFSASPDEQGRVAAKMAVSIMDGESALSIPFKRSQQFSFYMREDVFRRHSVVRIPVVYQSLARVSSNYYD